MSRDFPYDRWVSSLEQISGRIRELRRHHGLTQQELAEIADFSEKFLQQIEAGRKKEIWVSTVEKLAQGLGLSLSDFFGEQYLEKSRIPEKYASSRVHKKKSKNAR